VRGGSGNGKEGGKRNVREVKLGGSPLAGKRAGDGYNVQKRGVSEGKDLGGDKSREPNRVF